MLTLAAGIGANSAMFSVVRGVLLDPLPYPHAGELYRIFYDLPRVSEVPVQSRGFSSIIASEIASFESIAVFAERDLELSDSDRPERLTALEYRKITFASWVSTPAMGRDFQASDEIPGNQRVVILSR